MTRAELAAQERHPRTCRPKPGVACPQAPDHVVSYQFYGPEGRLNTSAQRVCTEHAKKVAERECVRIPRLAEAL